MKIAIVYLFLILISCKNSNEKYVAIESNVTDSEIYEVVNLVLSNKEEAIKRDMIKGAESPFKYLLDKDSGKTFDKNDSIKIFTGDSIFSNKDLSFIQKQINSRKNFKFNKDSIQIKSLKIISGDTIRSLIENGLKNPTKNF